MKHLPNILTSLRILAAGVFAYFFTDGRYAACCAVFAVSVLTDLLDGLLARANGWVSDVGKILDPVADKVTLLVVSACFYGAGWIPGFMLLAVILKEGLMMAGGLIMLRSRAVAYSDAFGKAGTVLFSISIAAALLKAIRISPLITRIGSISTPLFGLSVCFSFAALIHYGRTQFTGPKV